MMFKVKFDDIELRKWFDEEPHVSFDGFAQAISDDFFGSHVRSSSLASLVLAGDRHKLFLPFAQEWVYTEQAVPVAEHGKDELANGELYDTIVLPGIIQRVRDPFHLLRTTFARLKPAGTLIISVPLRDIAGETYRDPERNKRIYTASRLLLELQAALGFSAYRLRFAKEYGGTDGRGRDALPPSSLIMVFEKEAGQLFHPNVDRRAVDRSYDIVARSEEEGAMAIATSAILSAGLDPAAVQRVCVLKADHIGDFVMAASVFGEIRALFPAAEITCVCGGWNVEIATDLGYFDKVVRCDYFKQDERRGGLPGDEKARALQQLGDDLGETEFDLAIDLRVPQDSRPLLLAVRARFRAGVGSVEDYPFLDVALPALEAFNIRLSRDGDAENIHVGPAQFHGRSVVTSTPTATILAPREDDGEFIFGPYMPLRRGAYRATFKLSTLKLPGQAPAVAQVRADVAIGARALRSRDLQITSTGADHVLEFELYTDRDHVEFRVALAPGQEGPTLIFAGVTLENHSGRPPIRHMAVGQLHMKEQMSLLLALVRTRLFDRAIDPAVIRQRLRADAPQEPEAPFFALVPFSNSALRDWPFTGYEALARLILEQTGASVRLIGAPSHREQLDALVAQLSGRFPERIVSHAGLTWSDVYADLAHADAVVTNNSGMAHVGGLLGARVLGLYSASHQVMEWGALGASVTTLQARLPCGQCGFDTLGECAHGVRCMHLITPATVIDELRRIAPRSFGRDPGLATSRSTDVEGQANVEADVEAKPDLDADVHAEIDPPAGTTKLKLFRSPTR